MHTEQIGSLIKYYRERNTDSKHHLSQLDLAFEIGWENPSTLSRIEANHVIPTRQTILRIAKALKLTRQEVNTLLKTGNYLPLTPHAYEMEFTIVEETISAAI